MLQKEPKLKLISNQGPDSGSSLPPVRYLTWFLGWFLNKNVTGLIWCSLLLFQNQKYEKHSYLFLCFKVGHVRSNLLLEYHLGGHIWTPSLQVDTKQPKTSRIKNGVLSLFWWESNIFVIFAAENIFLTWFDSICTSQKESINIWEHEDGVNCFMIATVASSQTS